MESDHLLICLTSVQAHVVGISSDRSTRRMFELATQALLKDYWIIDHYKEQQQTEEQTLRQYDVLQNQQGV